MYKDDTWSLLPDLLRTPMIQNDQLNYKLKMDYSAIHITIKQTLHFVGRSMG